MLSALTITKRNQRTSLRKWRRPSIARPPSKWVRHSFYLRDCRSLLSFRCCRQWISSVVLVWLHWPACEHHCTFWIGYSAVYKIQIEGTLLIAKVYVVCDINFFRENSLRRWKFYDKIWKRLWPATLKSNCKKESNTLPTISNLMPSLSMKRVRWSIALVLSYRSRTKKWVIWKSW